MPTFRFEDRSLTMHEKTQAQQKSECLEWSSRISQTLDEVMDECKKIFRQCADELGESDVLFHKIEASLERSFGFLTAERLQLDRLTLRSLSQKIHSKLQSGNLICLVIRSGLTGATLVDCEAEGSLTLRELSRKVQVVNTQWREARIDFSAGDDKLTSSKRLAELAGSTNEVVLTAVASPVPSLDDVMEQCRRLVQECAQCADDEVDMDEDLRTYIDSLMMVELRMELQRQFETEVSGTWLFDYPTISSLSLHIREQLGLFPVLRCSWCNFTCPCHGSMLGICYHWCSGN